MSEFEHDSLEAREPEYEFAADKRCRQDECYYGIGKTTPPKDHTTVISIVLIMLIMICGVLSVLTLLDIDLLSELVASDAEQQVGTCVSFTPSSGLLPGGLEEVKQGEVNQQAPTTPDGEGMELQLAPLPTAPTGASSEEPTVPGETVYSGELSWQEVYEKVIPSVVSVVCSDGYATSSGTGVVMNGKGYIITNAHVVDDMTQIQVILNDDRKFFAQCMGKDTASDLAVLYIQADDLTPAEFGSSESLRVGDPVVAIGDPLGVELRGTMTDGIISAINRDLEIDGKTMSLLQTTAALNAGNSGGPLVNRYGQVVGINARKIGVNTTASGVEGIGFAIPMTTVKNVVEQLATIGYVAGRPDLGLEGQMLSAFYQHYYRLPSGMMITQVDSGSDAEAQGIREGDVLVYLDGTRITDLETYQRLVDGFEVDQQVSVMVYRGGQEYELSIIVGENKG